MSKKARRRPSWKKNRTLPFILHLINDETNELFEVVTFRGNTASFYHRMLEDFGHDFTEKFILEHIMEKSPNFGAQ